MLLSHVSVLAGLGVLLVKACILWWRLCECMYGYAGEWIV
jgi:hypothetical protein